MGAIKNDLLALFEEQNIEYKLDFSVALRSSFKIGGRVALAIFPNTSEQLSAAVTALYGAGVKHEIIGNGSNMLFAFDYYDGAFVFTEKLNKCDLYEEYIACGAGVSLAYFSIISGRTSKANLRFPSAIAHSKALSGSNS